MKIEVAQQTGHPIPQFVVYAESDADRAILRAFTGYKEHSKKPVRFWMHGATFNNEGCKAFNFGYIYEDSLKKPTMRQRVKRWWDRRAR